MAFVIDPPMRLTTVAFFSGASVDADDEDDDDDEDSTIRTLAIFCTDAAALDELVELDVLKLVEEEELAELTAFWSS